MQIGTDFAALLWEGAQRENVTLNESQHEKLCQHFQLLTRWQQVHNLTALERVHDMVLLHYIDCLKGLSFLAPANCADIGSGAGFPGLIAAVLWPNNQVVLVESSGKKCAFLRSCISAMRLHNVLVVNERAENYTGADHVLSRATFSTLNLKTLVGTVAPGGQIALWVGTKKSVEEVKQQGVLLNLQHIESHEYRLGGFEPRFLMVFHVKQ